MSRDNNRVIFHADMDAFFASIEQRDCPAYRGKPVIVGAKPGLRGVVSAASYEARTFGVRSAMPISEAYRRCPEGVYVRPRMSAYVRESEKVMAILHAFSPKIEPLSIDEAFVDMTGTKRLWGSPREAAAALAKRVRDELSLTVSIGIAPNKFLAKLASDLNKPDGITETPVGQPEIERWLSPLPVSRIWGVGPKAQAYLATLGVGVIGDLQRMPVEQLERHFGVNGQHLKDLSRGIDDRVLGPGDEVKSISREHTFNTDSSDPDLWKKTLLSLARDVGARARANGRKGSTVVLTYRTPDFKRRSRRKTLSRPSNLGKDIYAEAAGLLEEIRGSVHALRLIGVGLTNLDKTIQTDLFDSEEAARAWEASETAMDQIAQRWGDGAIFLAGEMNARRQTKRRTD